MLSLNLTLFFSLDFSSFLLITFHVTMGNFFSCPLPRSFYRSQFSCFCSIKTCALLLLLSVGAGDAFSSLGVTRVVRVLCNFFFIHYPVVFIVCVIFEAICIVCMCGDVSKKKPRMRRRKCFIKKNR